MKFQKRDLLTAIISCLITSLVFLYLNKKEAGTKKPVEFVSREKHPPPGQNGNGEGGDKKKDYNDLLELRDNFFNYAPKMYSKWKNPKTGRDEINRLEGFVFNGDDLREILDKNKFKPGGGAEIKKAEKVIFYFGADDTPFNNPDDNLSYLNIHLFAIGMTKDGTLMTQRRTLKDGAKLLTDESIFDQADPCPPNGPKN